MPEEEDFCTECLSGTSRKVIVKESVTLPFADPVEYEIEKQLCAKCGRHQEETFVNDAARQAGWEKARQSSIRNAIDQLTSSGVSLSYCERVLDLPMRSLSQWRNSGKASHGVEALLRLLAACPRLLEIAAGRYTEEAVRRSEWRSFGALKRDSITAPPAGPWTKINKPFCSEPAFATTRYDLAMMTPPVTEQKNEQAVAA